MVFLILQDQLAVDWGIFCFQRYLGLEGCDMSYHDFSINITRMIFLGISLLKEEIIAWHCWIQQLNS